LFIDFSKIFGTYLNDCEVENENMISSIDNTIDKFCSENFHHQHVISVYPPPPNSSSRTHINDKQLHALIQELREMQ
ncbi:hypothetical protein T11_3423, partial [Trichinella zimbabwensis]